MDAPDTNAASAQDPGHTAVADATDVVSGQVGASEAPFVSGAPAAGPVWPENEVPFLDESSDSDGGVSRDDEVRVMTDKDAGTAR